MPWSQDGENLSFTGPLADLMQEIMGVFDRGEIDAEETSPATYITASAIMLRGLLTQSLAEFDDAKMFLERLAELVTEHDDGSITVSTFEILEEVAEHIDPEALRQWLADEGFRASILELARGATEE